MERVVLQVALDLPDLSRVIRIADESVKGGADWVEAGTPLIKSEGMSALRELKKRFQDKKIVADMKTFDVGAFEVEMASKAGADVVIIMGLADELTIKDSIRAGAKYGTKIMVDLMGVSDKIKRAKEVEKWGADYICIHVGIDEQMVGVSPYEEVKKLVNESMLPLAVAGGLNSENIPSIIEAGASVIIVGGAITKAPDVKSATEKIKKAIEEKKSIKTELYKKYSSEELYKAFSKVSSSNVSDAMHRKGAMVGVKAIIKNGRKIVGKAITIKTIDGDWAKPVEAVDIAKKGDVIVIDAGSGQKAVWGELASWSSKLKGIEGVIIDGAVRDVQDILKIDFPVFAKEIVPDAGEPKGYGEIGCEIVCFGQTVKNGDWIIGDESGVVVVPKERAQEIANRALDVLEKENRIREEIKRGSTLSKVLELYKWEKVG
ncbi:MAG: 3-hexulose-6-phosphate synthase [Candidatus Thermoplasmatota archaeon]